MRDTLDFLPHGAPTVPTVRRLFTRAAPRPELSSVDAAAGAEVFELLDERHAPAVPTGSRAVAVPVLAVGRAGHYVLALADGRLLLEHVRPITQYLPTNEGAGLVIAYTNGRREFVPVGAVRRLWRVLYWCFVPAEDDERPVVATGTCWPYSDN